MSPISKFPLPFRCERHKDFNPEHLCGGKKCNFNKNNKPYIYRPFDYIYEHSFKRFVLSNLRYIIKWEINYITGLLI